MCTSFFNDYKVQYESLPKVGETSKLEWAGIFQNIQNWVINNDTLTDMQKLKCIIKISETYDRLGQKLGLANDYSSPSSPAFSLKISEDDKNQLGITDIFVASDGFFDFLDSENGKKQGLVMLEKLKKNEELTLDDYNNLQVGSKTVKKKDDCVVILMPTLESGI